MSTTVRRPGDGPVLVGRRPAGPSGVAVVGLRGVDVEVDPSDPDGAAFLVVVEPEEAHDAVLALRGPAVADAVLRVARSGDAERTTATVGWLAATVTRVAVTDWLREHAPDPLETALLDVEGAVAVAGLAPHAAGHTVECADDALRRHAARIARWSTLARSVPPPAGLGAMLGVARPLALDLLDRTSPAADELLHEVELGEALGHDGSPPVLDWDAALRLLADRSLPLAVHAGVDVAPAAERRASVDWGRVPRGLLDTGEDTVRWRGPDAAGIVHLEVRASPAAPPSHRLGFGVYVAGRALPLALGELRLDRAGESFRGAVLVPTTPPDLSLVVDVCDIVDPRPPRLGRAAVTARAERWAARGLTALRLGADEPARGALEEAARVHAAAAAAPGARSRGRSLRREARCAALQQAVLARAGQPRLARALGRAWASPEDPVGADDTTPPALDTQGWALTVAERALGVPGWSR